MRIISGKFKGHRLVEFKADNIRPTTDRVKQTIFDKLMGEVPESRVLDLFSGTGNLAIEALSRGAVSALSVELNRKSLQIMEQNKAKLKVGNEWEMRSMDVFKFLKGYSGEPFDLIFCDPPFTESFSHDLMQSIATSGVFKTGTQLIIESAAKEKIEDSYPPFLLLDRREFGDKKVSFFSAQ